MSVIDSRITRQGRPPGPYRPDRRARWRRQIAQQAARARANAILAPFVAWLAAVFTRVAASIGVWIDSLLARLPFGAAVQRFFRRATSFSLVGGFVAVAGLGLQFALVQYGGMDKHVAYLIQSVVSIELNFTLNNFFTWRDRRAPGFKGLVRTWLKFHGVRVITVTLNQLLYAVLLWLGLQYLLANVACIAIILAVNFWSGDKFIFSASHGASATLEPPPGVALEPDITPDDDARWLPRRAATRWPSVSVIIPVKHDQEVIAATVSSLLDQDYRGQIEIILVGDRDDPTWRPIQPWIDAGQLTIIEADVYHARQGVNARRNIGLRQARGQIIALVEADMTLPNNWVASGVERIRAGWPVVVGSVEQLNGGLLADYLDTAAYFRRTARRAGADSAMRADECVVDMERFGSAAYRLPITSNVFLSRDVLYYARFPDPDFDRGYDDYQWHWELARADVAILSAPSVRAIRRTPLTWRSLLGRLLSAGMGCATFIQAYPRAAFTARRLEQAIGATLALIALLALALAGVVAPAWPEALGLHGVGAAPISAPSGALALGLVALVFLGVLLILGMVAALRMRSARGVVFPFLTIIAGFAFLAGLARGLLRRAAQSRAPHVRFSIASVTRQVDMAATAPSMASVAGGPDYTAEHVADERAWSAAGPRITGSFPTLVRESLATAWPSVSVVVPVKNSQRTIGAAVESLLDQDYPGTVEILLVGDVNDPTWEPIRQHIASGRVSVIEATIKSANRDSNAKRSIGLRAARSEILALTDSDMVLPRNWVSTGINYMLKGWPCVAGPMRGATGDFWDQYADQVQVGSKTPRFKANVIVDKTRFDAARHKPPITANVFFTRDTLARAGEFDSSFTHSYEDYSWFWQACAAGTTILCTPDLTADHYHRQGWKQLVRQYTRAGRGCGDFVVKYPESPLSRARLIQLAGVWVALLAVASLVFYSIISLAWPVALSAAPADPLTQALQRWTPLPPGLLILLALAVAGAGGLLALGVRNALTTARPVAVAYPFITTVFALAFSRGLTEILARAFGRWVAARRMAVASWAALAGVAGLGMALRLWSLDTKPGVEWDEPVYANVAWHLLHTGDQYLKPEIGHGPTLYFSQPPFYFALLAAWYWLTGANAGEIIQSARTLAALMSVATLVFLYLILRRRMGMWALVPVLLITVDSWVVFSSRISWIDNTAIPIGLAGLWLYDRAMQRERSRSFLIAGVVIAVAVLFKYLAIYFCIAIAINWFLTRRKPVEHAILLVTVALLMVDYMVVTESVFAFSLDNPFILQNLHQILRVTDSVSSRGNVTSVQQVVAALVAQYRVFAVTIALCAAGGLALVVDMARCVWRRTLEPLRRHSLEASWALAAFIVFGAVQIKFINYFAYVMIPLLVYLGVRVVDFARAWTSVDAPRREWARAGFAVALLAVVAFNLLAFNQRIADRQDDTFVSVQAYAATLMPAHDQVVTEQPIGTMIQQPYCQLIHLSECQRPKWVILFVSLTEKPPADPRLTGLLAHSTVRAVYYGFKETVYIYQIETPPSAPARIVSALRRPPLTLARMHWITSR